MLVSEVKNKNFLRNSLVVLDGVVADGTTFSAPRFHRITAPFADCGLARSQAVLDVTLEDDTIAFSETEGLVVGRQHMIAFGGEAGEDAVVDRATETIERYELRTMNIKFILPIIIDNLECTLGVLGHGNARSCKDAIGSCKGQKLIVMQIIKAVHLTIFWNFNSERQAISNTNSLNFSVSGIQNADSWWWRLGR